MSDDGMSPSVREGDLLVISKIDQEIRTDDIVLACLESCRVMRVIASNDIVEVRDDVLVVNQEESRKLLEGDASKVIDWKIKGGYLLAETNGNSFTYATRDDIEGRVITNVRIRNFSVASGKKCK